MLEGDLDRIDNGGDGFGKALGDLALTDDDFFRHAVHQVAAFDLHGFAVALFRRAGATDFLFDPLGGAFAHQQVMVAADVVDDRFVHHVATDAHGARIDDAAERQDGHFGRAAADIHHHASGRFRDRQAGADRRGHGLLDQVDLAGAGGFGGFLDGAAFHGGRAGRDAHDHQGAGETAAVMHLADEVLDHLLSHFEVRDHAIT